MPRRRYSPYVFALFSLFALIRACQPVTPGGNRTWSAAGLFTLSLVGLALLILEQRAIGRAHRPKHVCAHCGYDRTGISESAACPECGAGVKSICIQCRGDMTGMEDRVCPRCGVMYGVETISKD